MERLKTAYLLALMLLPSDASMARDIDGHFAVLAPGGNSCAEYLATTAEDIEYQRDYANWLSGYFSAFNQIVASTYNIMGDASADEILQRIDAHCRSNEGELFINAAAAVTRQLYESRANLSPNVDNRVKWTDLGKISEHVK